MHACAQHATTSTFRFLYSEAWSIDANEFGRIRYDRSHGAALRKLQETTASRRDLTVPQVDGLVSR